MSARHVHHALRAIYSITRIGTVLSPSHTVTLTRPAYRHSHVLISSLLSTSLQRSLCAQATSVSMAALPKKVASPDQVASGESDPQDVISSSVFDHESMLRDKLSKHGLSKPVSESLEKTHEAASFSSFKLSPAIMDRLTADGISEATEVQAGTFNLIYDGHDIIAKSRTGTGKTLAFALPILERLHERSRSRGPVSRGGGPHCVVLAPTRELAKQVAREMEKYGRELQLSVQCFYGGSSYSVQEKALSQGLDILVGTPGRIIDHIERGSLRLSDVLFTVLDEADEMLSMGFAQDVERIFESLPSKKDRQVILFSATVPSWVKGLASQYQKENVVTFDAVTTGSMAATTVRHCAVRVPEREEARAGLLADIIAVHSWNKAESSGIVGNHESDCIEASSNKIGEKPETGVKALLVHPEGSREEIGPSRAIVFAETKKEADELATSGALDGCGAAVLHGDVAQRQREIILSQFRNGKFQVLVATDVAARGLDISGVDVVVQYRVPRDAESYIHRAGRTGRAGRSGTAVILYSDRETGLLRTLEKECKVKFDYESAPAPEAALEAAVDVSLANLWAVDEKVTGHLMGRAEEVSSLDPTKRTQTIAGLLALAGRRTRLEDRSVLSGEAGRKTVRIWGRTSSGISPGRAMEFLRSVGMGLKKTIEVDVGLIRMCRDGSTVVDVASDQALLLVSGWKDAIKNGGYESSRYDGLDMSIALEVPALVDGRQNQDRGRIESNRRRGRDPFSGRQWGRGERFNKNYSGNGGWRNEKSSNRRGSYGHDRNSNFNSRGRRDDRNHYERDGSRGGYRQMRQTRQIRHDDEFY